MIYMVTIYTSATKLTDIQNIIDSQFRMNELVEVVDYFIQKPISSGLNIIINHEGIRLPIDWHNIRPPYILQEHIWFTEENLLGLIYFILGNSEATTSFLGANSSLLSEIKIIESLINGSYTNPDQLSVETYQEFDDYRLMHNQAITRHYGSIDLNEGLEKIHYFYNAALDSAPSYEYRAFSAKHYMNFLFDINEKSLAEKIGRDTLTLDISIDGKAEITNILCQINISNLTVPYDQNVIEELKNNLWSTLKHYESQGRSVEAAILYDSASYIANISDSFAESLGYISKAIKIFEEEGIEEFYYNAFYKKALLLYNWAKNGNSQFFKPAIDAYQESLKFFKRDDYPYIFADIQHHLGVIYSEIPDEAKKKSIWAAVSSSSFLEALNIYKKDEFPYEYALVSNSYANALTNYPQAIHSDNYEKALYFYNEALEIRKPSEYPFERSLTLLNYLEASWNADNSSNESNFIRFNDMWSKAEEIISLNVNQKFVEEAKEHLTKLELLKARLEEV